MSEFTDIKDDSEGCDKFRNLSLYCLRTLPTFAVVTTSSPPGALFDPFEPSLALSGLSLPSLRFRSGLFLAFAPCGDKVKTRTTQHASPVWATSLLEKAHAHRPALPCQSFLKYVCTVKVRTQSTNLTPYQGGGEGEAGEEDSLARVDRTSKAARSWLSRGRSRAWSRSRPSR